MIAIRIDDISNSGLRSNFHVRSRLWRQLRGIYIFKTTAGLSNSLCHTGTDVYHAHRGIMHLTSPTIRCISLLNIHIGRL